MNAAHQGVPIAEVRVGAYRIPTDAPEADGTLDWDATTLVVVTLRAGAIEALGYTYADRSTAVLIHDTLAALVRGSDAFDAPGIRRRLLRAVRNLGGHGIAAMAVAAVDNALWDLRAKLLGVSLLDLVGAVRARVPLYGSGGFTSYPERRLCAQLAGWVEAGIARVKMKVGREPDVDPARVAAARRAIGADAELYVDANGAYAQSQALALAAAFARERVTWFEEPLSSDDLAGLAALRRRLPPGMELAAGEYGYDCRYFERMLAAQAVDVLQADATRCGVSGFIAAAALCSAHGLALSSHCAPALHAALGCALPAVRHLEYFHDHVRIERLLFDGVPQPVDGAITPDRTRPGFGFAFKTADAAEYAL